MTELNVPNRTLAIMDNLTFLRSLNNECIDLIAIDPPFATRETFKKIPKKPITVAELDEEVALAQAHGVAHSEGIGETRVKDVWKWDKDIHPDWKASIEEDYPSVFSVIQAVEECASENEAAYICFMAVRLIECRRVLKSTGSIYVHCDWHANSYLRMLLDAIFGAKQYRNEIVWCYTGPGNTKRWFPRKSDRILFYTKSNDATFNVDDMRIDYKQLNVQHSVDSQEGGGIGGQLTAENVDEYRERGKVVEDYWLEGRDQMTPVGRKKSENTGYSTQKPVALYERIIKASSKPGDVVLDVFAGCATTVVAAELQGRQWVACDMAYRAWTMLKRRFYLNGYALSDTTQTTPEALGQHQTALQEAVSFTIGPNELPERDDQDPVPYHGLKRPRRRSTQSATWSGRIPKDEAKALLIDRFGPVCWGCGYEPRRPNGSLDDTLLEVDHIRARKADEGKPGNDELYNLALLHRTCNGIKRNKLTLEELRTHNAENQLLWVSDQSELIDLYAAVEYAQEKIAQHVAEHGYQALLADPVPA